MQNQKNEKLIKFHYDNPLIYQLFKKYTLERIKLGFEKYSAEAILNRVRWDNDVQTSGADYKIPNEMKPFYSRLFTNKKSKHSEFFVQKKSVCDEINFDNIYEKL